MYLIYYFFCLTFVSMSEKLLKKMIDDLYPECKITIKSFEVLSRKRFDGSEWVKDRPAFFIGVDCLSCDYLENINDDLTLLTGCEINIFKI